MLTLRLPTFTWNDRLEDRADHWQSIVIACVRGLAAIEVAAAHLRALFYPGTRTIFDPPLWYQAFAFFTGFGHQAVLLFFVISGWLVGGSLLNKWYQKNAVSSYAIDRVTRLWTVLIPVFTLTLLLGRCTKKLDGNAIDFISTSPYSAPTFVGNLVGLQLIKVPNFGENFALWSLSNETWYYIMFPMLLFTIRAVRFRVRATVAVLLAILAINLPLPLLMYFGIWLLGAACSRLRIGCRRAGRNVLILIALSASAFCRMTGINEDLSVKAFLPDLLLSCLFLAIICSLQKSVSPPGPYTVRLGSIGRNLAAFSFTLYAMHVPLIHAFRYAASEGIGPLQLSPDNPAHLAWFAFLLGFLIFSAWLFYLLFETHTTPIRNALKRWLFRHLTPTNVALESVRPRQKAG